MKKVIVQIWNSPTFTTWGNQAVQALRLLAVTPLILVSFNVTEIAAWYLYGSLTFLGSLVSQRVGLTFSRMIAFAMGGAKDLSPIKGKVEKRETSVPNWALIEKVYATTGSLNALLTIVIAISAIGLGWYGLEKILIGYEDSTTIWMTLAVMVISQSLVFFFQQYSMALRGMNHVALSNRWEVVFSLLSIFAGVLTLKFGGGILQVGIVMQGITLCSIPRNRFLIRHVEEGRFRKFKTLMLDRQILAWAWEPTWKGFIVTLANSGTFQMAGVLVARFLPVADTAAILLSLRVLNSLRNVSSAPLTSHMPLIAKWFAEGRTEDLQKLVLRKILISQGIFSAIVVVFAYLGPLLLHQIGSNAELLSRNILLLLGLLLVTLNFLQLSLYISASGNHVVCVIRSIWAFILSSISMYLLIPAWGVYGLIMGIFLPNLLILNFEPARTAARRIDLGVAELTIKSTMIPIIVTAIFYLISMLFS